MAILTVFVFAITSIITGVYSVMPVDLPFNLEDGNWLIKSKLTSAKDSYNIDIHEYIHSSDGTIRGNIVFKVDEYPPCSNFYTNKDLHRRVIKSGTYCNYFRYDGRWSHYIGALKESSFLNDLILVGPSVFFRIIQYEPTWTSGRDAIIRGVKHHKAIAALNDNLKVWFYYKDGDKYGLKRPTRVLFELTSYNYNYEVNQYWFDIYTISQVDQNFDAIVSIKPGMLCENYLSDYSSEIDRRFPKLTWDSVHFISKTRSFNAGPSKKQEVYANAKYQIASIKSSVYEEDNKTTTTETIYDYQLGVEYEFTEDGKCSVSPMKLSSPGLIQSSSLAYKTYKLDLNRLLNFDLDYHYLGPVTFNEQDEIGIHGWQKYEEYAEFEHRTYPYFVITQYFREQTDKQTDYTLVGTTLKGYDRNRVLTTSRTTAYFDYGHEISSSEFANKFHTQDCYSDPKSKRTLQFHFTCEDSHCDNSEKIFYQLQDKVKESLVNTGAISASRISNIEPIISSKEIIIYVTILDFPNIKNAFEMRTMKLALPTSSRVIIDGDEEDCLRRNSFEYEPFEAIAFCVTEGSNVCQKIDGKTVKLVEDENGISCSVFMTPLKNVYRYSRELPLDNIHEKLNHIEISLTSPDNEKIFKLTSYQVTDVTKINSDDFSPLFESTIENTKLIEDKVNTISVIGASDLSACYRECVHSVENNCKSFSFCSNQDKAECLVSTMSNVVPETSGISHDSSCKTYLIESLSKYKKIPSKKFLDNQESVRFESTLDKCASSCYKSDLCKSFEFCSGLCSFAGYYTDSSSEHSEECDIYIPKVLDEFKVTGRMIVKKIFHTELSLSADQCAALCHDWNDDGENCKSFNFCPTNGKNPSLCHLSEYSSHDANVKLIHSDTCQNYEIPKHAQQATNAISKSTHSITIFGAIMLFSVSGLVLGIIAALTFKKSFTKRKNDVSTIYDRNTFSWTKQLNDDRQSVNAENSFQGSSDYAVATSEGTVNE